MHWMTFPLKKENASCILILVTNKLSSRSKLSTKFVLSSVLYSCLLFLNHYTLVSNLA